MESTEKKSDRLNRVEMHDFFLEKIDDAIKNDRYIEASWLIYSCFENRYFRTVEKIKEQCKYSNGKCKEASNELALTTKIKCIERLATDESCTCFSNNFPAQLFEETRKWVKKRNKLMHNLLQLEYYESMFCDFKEVAENGKDLLLQTYDCCTKFRKDFYDADYKFVFPKSLMEQCRCSRAKRKKE